MVDYEQVKEKVDKLTNICEGMLSDMQKMLAVTTNLKEVLVDFEKVKENVDKLTDFTKDLVGNMQKMVDGLVEVEKIKETIKLFVEKDQNMLLAITENNSEINKIKENFKKLTNVQIQSFTALKDIAEAVDKLEKQALFNKIVKSDN